jgi:putative heme iron utilization protein
MAEDRVLSDADVDRIITHMNDKHADDLVCYAQVYAEVSPVDAARMTDIDAEGFDLEVDTGEATTAVRVDFDSPLDTAAEARSALVDLALEARKEAEQ